MTNPIGSLFERIGGAGAALAVIETFYRRVEADDVLRPIYPDELAPGRERLALFFVQWLGGPTGYSDRYGHPRLRRRHFPFVIDERAAVRWLRLMGEAMDECGVSAADAAVVVERLRPLAHHLVNAHEDVPRDTVGSAWLD